MPPSPRRSTRGAPLPTKPAPPASTTSSSSLSSSRQDRTIRTVANNPKASTPRSLSSEDTSEPPRRSQRSQQPKQEDAAKDSNDAEDETGEDAEITRCICGLQEYPGAPLSEAFTDAELEDPDLGSLFISCDHCGVWQHAGCVGIAYESQVPDKYYCEQCRPKRHELHTDTRGQKYSLYSDAVPKKNRKTSVSKHGDRAQKERESVDTRGGSADPTPGRRRATMRSKEHDDEEALIQRAIEESRREVEGRRIAKRAREDSEDNNIAKRQRRVSESHLKAAVFDEDESEDQASKAKQTKAESARQSELREKEKERERARAEAAGRRQERAGRRRVEDDAADETPNPVESNRTSPPQSPQQQGSPAPQDKVSHKKSAGKKMKKLGNNQYTNKSRGESEVAASSPQLAQNHTSAGSSGDERLPNGKSILQANGNGGSSKQSPDRANGGGNGKGKFGRGKHKGVNGNGISKEEKEPAELTFAVMKRRMEAMTSFISKAQVEIAGGDRTPSSDGHTRPTPTIEEGLKKLEGGAVKPAVVRIHVIGDGEVEEKKFEEMSALEMAEVLSRRIGEWHGKYDQFV